MILVLLGIGCGSGMPDVAKLALPDFTCGAFGLPCEAVANAAATTSAIRRMRGAALPLRYPPPAISMCPVTPVFEVFGNLARLPARQPHKYPPKGRIIHVADSPLHSSTVTYFTVGPRTRARN